MKKLSIGILILLALVGWWFFQKKDHRHHSASSPTPPLTLPSQEPTLGDHELKSYASAQTSAEQDLTLLGNYLKNVFLLVKTHDPRHYASNEELVAFLLGKNPHRTAFLSPHHPIINGERQLIDRWETPLHFHQLSRQILEIRSAGPDQKPYTDDDLLFPEYAREFREKNQLPHQLRQEP